MLQLIKVSSWQQSKILRHFNLVRAFVSLPAHHQEPFAIGRNIVGIPRYIHPVLIIENEAGPQFGLNQFFVAHIQFMNADGQHPAGGVAAWQEDFQSNRIFTPIFKNTKSSFLHVKLFGSQ